MDEKPLDVSSNFVTKQRKVRTTAEPTGKVLDESVDCAVNTLVDICEDIKVKATNDYQFYE